MRLGKGRNKALRLLISVADDRTLIHVFKVQTAEMNHVV